MTTEKKQTYNVLVPEKYIGADKVERTSYFQVGVAFPAGKDNKGLRIHLAPNVTVSGDILIMPRTARAEAAAPTTTEDTGTAGSGFDSPF